MFSSSFNKNGNIEIEGNVLKYSLLTEHLGTDEPEDIEKDVKRKLNAIGSEHMLVLPMNIQSRNRYMVVYYDLQHYKSFEYLRELMLLEDQLPYFKSIVQLAKAQKNGLKIVWNLKNFVIDVDEIKVKALMFETDYLKVYDEVDVFQEIKEMLIYCLTTRKKLLSLPTKNDFFNPSDENIKFVETVYNCKSLDDLGMYLDALEVDFEEIKLREEELQPSKKRNKKSIKKPKAENNKPRPVTQRVATQKRPAATNSSQKKKEDKGKKMMIMAFGFVGFAIILSLIAPAFTGGNSEKEPEVKAQTTIADMVKGEQVYKDNKEHDSEMVAAYRKAYNSEFSEAYALLKKVPKDEISSNDVKMVIAIYNETDHLDELLSEMPVMATDVITYLITNDSIDSLPEINERMQTKNPYIQFEVYYMEEKYDEMLKLKDKVEINGRKEEQIVTAYLSLGKQEEAKVYADETGNPELIKQVDSYSGLE
ncbi:hypothetical protein [Terribacillus saccharophilus]|uniref:hypothetical protein n=1 Tax=Terribacillus saccharophilus TaxID=361277 RepID=UPI002989D849|nr:hypothetical protein [Terribacillus saccharophilus]MCM3227555.1 hypothetical protein [Terribacillus saccharophilus]